MHSVAFQKLSIVKKSTVMRDPVGRSERLAVTLRYLVTDAQCTSAASYRISPTTIGRVLSETCDALWVTLLTLKCIDPPVISVNRFIHILIFLYSSHCSHQILTSVFLH